MTQPIESEQVNILIVDGFDSDFKETSDLLEEAKNTENLLNGLNLDRANSYKSALETLNQKDVKIILLELSLPDINGIETFYYLKTLKPKIPIVILSKTNDEEVTYAALKGGAQDYLVKGEVSAHFLAHTITSAIERGRLIQELDQLRLKAEQENREKAELMYHFASDTQELVNAAFKASQSAKYIPSLWDKDKLITKAGLMIKNLAETLEYIKDYSDLELGRLTLNCVSLDLNDAVNSILDEILVFDDGVAYNVEEDLSEFANDSAKFDIKRLKEISQCLYKNFLLFTNPSDSLQIKVSTIVHQSPKESKVELRFALKIKGKELSHAEQNLLNESISQSDLMSFKKYGINGLELSIVSKITKIMGGRIWLESSPEEGTVLYWNALGTRPVFG